MHWDKTVTRIHLLFSVANVALAAPVVRNRHMDMAVAALEKRLLSNSDESPDLGSYHYLPASDSLDDSQPNSPAASFHEGDAPDLIFPPMSSVWWSYHPQDSASFHDSVPSSPHYGSPPDPLSAASDYDSAHESLSGSSDYKSALESSVGSLTPSGSVGSMPELVSDSEESANSAESVSGSESSSGSSYEYPPGPFQEDQGSRLRLLHSFTYWGLDQDSTSSLGSAPESSAGSMTHSGSVGSIPELVSDSEEPANSPEPMSHSSPYHPVPGDLDDKSHYLTPPELPSGSNQYLTTPGSGSTPSTHDDSVPVSVNPSRLDDSAPDLLAASTHDNSLASVSTSPSTPDNSAPEPGAPPLHNDLLPESETPQLHDDMPPQADKLFDDALKALFRRGPLVGTRNVVDQSRSLLRRL